MSIYTKCANMQNMYRSKNVRCAELLVDDWIFFFRFPPTVQKHAT